MKVNVKLKPLHPKFITPTKSHPSDAGYDLVALDITLNVEENELLIKFGFAMEIEEGWKAVAVPRSSLTKTKWILQNSPCQFDSSYRGEVMLKFRAMPEGVDEDRNLIYPIPPFSVGERVAQMYFAPVHEADFEKSEFLSETVRGVGGFGSTGK